MKLHFKRDDLENLIEITENATAHTVPYTGKNWGRPKETTPGLMLVGDTGVYFMSNADEQEKVPGTDSLTVAYAVECDPGKVDRDTLWSVKRASFGGDDGAEFFALEEFKKIMAANPGEFLPFDVSPGGIQVMTLRAE